MLEDLRRLRALELDPVLNCIRCYLCDAAGGPVATDVYAFYADSAPVAADTWRGTYRARMAWRPGLSPLRTVGWIARMKPLFASLRACVVTLGAVALVVAAEKKSAPPAPEQFVYFGTYTKAKSKGIYRARFDAATGRLSPVELAAEARDPSFLAVHPNGRVLYAIDESTDPQKTPGRGLAAYAIEAGTGKLALRNEQGVGGAGPCHLAVDATARAIVVANYAGGSIAAVALEPDGRLGALGSVIQHTGLSVHPTRQKAPHAHVAALAPDNRFVLCADLGLDKILVYALDAAKATLIPATPAAVALAPGAGPRHLAFRPDGKFVYAINELRCTMTALRYDATSGGLAEVQTLSTLPTGESVRQGFSTAEVVAHPGGRFLYGSNRGHDSIAVYAIDAATGRLTLVGHEPTQGKTPRHFAVDPSGRWLLAENQGSDSVVVFRIDAASGRLEPTGQAIEVPAPVCAVFVPAR